MGRAGQLLALGRPLRRGNGPRDPRAPGQLPASPHPCPAHPGRASHTRVSPAREGACSAATASAAIESAAAGILVTIAHLLSPRWSRSVYCRVAGHPCLEQNVPAYAGLRPCNRTHPGRSRCHRLLAIASQLCGGMVAAPPDQHGDPVQDPALALASAGTCRPLPSSAGSRASCASDSPAGAPHMIKPGETSAFQSPYQPGWGTTSVELTGTAQARSNLGARPMRAVLRCPDGSSSVERGAVRAVRQAGRQYRWLRFTGLNAFPQDAQ